MKALQFLFLSLYGLGACSDSQTTKDLESFADKVCQCQDAACAEQVGVDYLQWRKDNQRARGSEGDRKDIENANERYAKCHLKLVGPAKLPSGTIPKVDLTPPKPEPSSESNSDSEVLKPAKASSGALEDKAKP